jgi:hypothetical protein
MANGRWAALGAALGGTFAVALGCGGGGGGDGSTEQTTYAFQSRFVDGQSSVSYTGQIHRHALILEIVDKLAGSTNGLAARITAGASFTDGQFEAELAAIYDNTAATTRPLAVTAASTPSAVLQTNYAQLDGTKNLREKTAGNDASTDHKDWDAPGNFQGWSTAANDLLTAAAGFPVENASPEALIRAFFATVDDLAVLHSDSDPLNDPVEPGTTTAIARPFITEDGLDLRQLIQKFLLGAVAFSQGCDDYFDDAAGNANNGLLADNTQDGANPFARLEHQWDEGYGYFGAVRDLLAYTDEEYAGSAGRPEFKGAHDTDGDGFIDLVSERGFGHSVNAASRDRDSHPLAKTDFTGDAFRALIRGRAILANAQGVKLSAAELAAARVERNALVLAWEKAIAATIVHYINLTIRHTDEIGTPAYSFVAHAQHWGEMKGFALGLQFNPRSPMLGDFVQLHTLIGDRPIHAGDALQLRSDYKAQLLQARDLVEAAYDFDPLNMGDANGAGGW